MTGLRFTFLVACCACGARPVAEPETPDRIAIIVAERGAQGARLVVLDERGDRQFDLVECRFRQHARPPSVAVEVNEKTTRAIPQPDHLRREVELGKNT